MKTPVVSSNWGEDAVRAALHAHLLPEVGHAEIADDHLRGPVVFIAEVVEVRALADVVNLGGNCETFLLG